MGVRGALRRQPRATRKYPWGNDLPVPARAGNWGDA